MLSVMKRVSENVIQHTPLNGITEKIRTEAETKFEVYRCEKIVLSEWKDEEWLISNQKQHYRINFGRKEFKVRKVCKDYSGFVNNLKIFVMLRIGTCAVEHLQTMVAYIIDETINSQFYKTEIHPSDKAHGFPLMYYVEWLELIPEVAPGYLKFCKRELSIVRSRNAELKKQKHPTTLCEFQAYFKFDWMIRDYWKNSASKEERALYWPLYLFWIITTIIPMRVSEFCVMDLNCIKQERGKYYLTIRRSRMKGHGLKIYTYTIKGDYYECTYEIPRWVYDCIWDYRKITEKEQHPCGLLFSARFLTKIEGRAEKMKRPDRLFVKEDLGHLLECFYENVIIGQYRYQVVTDKDLKKRYVDTEDSSMELEPGETMMIQPRHTRHLAMINLIMRGCNPIIIKEFAGHADAAISENYYGNISKVIRCAAKTFYDRVRNRNSDAVIFDFDTNAAAYLPRKTESTIVVDHGQCCSAAFISNQIDDCIPVNGNCLRCNFLRRTEVIEAEISVQEEKVDTEIKLVMELLKDPKLEQKIEEYQREVLGVQENIAVLYRQYCSLWEVRNAKEKEISG